MNSGKTILPTTKKTAELQSQKSDDKRGKMNSKVNLAILGIRISTIIYYLIILGCLVSTFFVSGVDLVLPIVLATITLPFVIFLEILIIHIRKRKYWAWIAGLIVGGLYIPSLFFPFGAMIFIGLLTNASRKEFESTNKIVKTGSGVMSF